MWICAPLCYLNENSKGVHVSPHTAYWFLWNTSTSPSMPYCTVKSTSFEVCFSIWPCRSSPRWWWLCWEHWRDATKEWCLWGDRDDAVQLLAYWKGNIPANTHTKHQWSVKIYFLHLITTSIIDKTWVLKCITQQITLSMAFKQDESVAQMNSCYL